MSIDLDAIRQREQAATPGPWRVVEEHGRDIADEAYSRITIQSDSGDRNDIAELIGDDFSNGSDRPNENAEFIAHAREDIPALIAEVERLRARLDRIATTATEAAAEFDGEGAEIPARLMRAVAEATR